MIFGDEDLVDENASGFRINESSYKKSLGGVHSFKSDKKI